MKDPKDAAAGAQGVESEASPAVGKKKAHEECLPYEVEDYLGWLSAERGRSPNTVAAYRRDLRTWCFWLIDEGLSAMEVAPENLEQWVADRRGEGRAPASVTRGVVAVRSLYRFLADEGDLRIDPFVDVDVPPVPQGIPKALDEEEVQRLLEAVEGADPLALRDRAILEILYGTGIRIGELVGLSLANLDLIEGSLRVMGKGRRERVVPLGRMAAAATSEWLSPGGRPELVPDRRQARSDETALFIGMRGNRLTRQGAWGVVKRHGAKAGLGAKLTPHVLRHSCRDTPARPWG